MSNSKLKALRGIGYNKATKARRASLKTTQISPTSTQSRVDSACNQAGICAFLKSRKRTDITNHHCNKKSNKTPTVRVKEKRRLGFKEPRI